MARGAGGDRERTPVTPEIRFWRTVEQLRPGSANVCWIRRSADVLDPVHLLAAARGVVARRDVLTCAIRRNRVRHLDWRSLYCDFVLVPDEASASGVVVEECFDEGELRDDPRPFDLAKPPFFRLRYVREGRGTLLALTLHHCIVDWYSANLVWRDLVALYRTAAGGPDAELAPPGSFLQYASDRFRVREAGKMDKHIRFWQALLADAEQPQLPHLEGSTPPRSASAPPVDASHATLGETSRAVLEKAGRLRVTPFAIVVGLFAVALHRVFGWDRVVLLVPSANRRRGDSDVVGHLATMLFVPFDGLSRTPIDAVVKHAAATLMKALTATASPAEALGIDGLRRLGNPLVVIRLRPTASAGSDQTLVQVVSSAPRPASTFGTDTDLMLDVYIHSVVGLVLTHRQETVDASWPPEILQTMRAAFEEM